MEQNKRPLRAYIKLTPNPAPTNDNIIVPKRIDITPIALPPKVHACNLRHRRPPLPLCRIRVGHSSLDRQARHCRIVQPRLHCPVSTQVVLEARPGVDWEGGRCSDTLGREVRKSSVVCLAVVHEDLGLAADAEVLFGALSGIGHGDEGDVRIGQGFGSFPVRIVSICHSYPAN